MTRAAGLATRITCQQCAEQPKSVAAAERHQKATGHSTVERLERKETK